MKGPEKSNPVQNVFDAPFSDEIYKAGARIFPNLVSVTPDNPASEANRKAWQALGRFEKPFLTAFFDGDPITKGGDQIFPDKVPDEKGQPHTTIKNGGHFLQEDVGENFAKLVLGFMSQKK